MKSVTAVVMIILIALTTGMQAYHMRRKKHFKKTLVVGWCIACLAIIASIAAIYFEGVISVSGWLNKLSPI